MVRIDRMQIRLPAGYEHRAPFIARLVGESMKEYQPKEDRKLERLSIGPIRIGPNATDHDIARDVVRQITLMLGG